MKEREEISYPDMKSDKDMKSRYEIPNDEMDHSLIAWVQREEASLRYKT